MLAWANGESSVEEYDRETKTWHSVDVVEWDWAHHDYRLTDESAMAKYLPADVFHVTIPDSPFDLK